MRNGTWFATSHRTSLLCLFPWLEVGGADLVNLNIVRRLNPSLFNVSIIATLKSCHRWYEKFSAITPHVYALANFIPEDRYADFLLYFIESRRVDLILISNSLAGFNMIPLIKRRYPGVRIVDLQHMEEPHWWGGGYPRIGSHFDAYLDRRITVSAYLKKYMVDHFGIEPGKVEVIHNGIECRRAFNPDNYPSGEFRKELGIADGTRLITMVGRVCEQKQPLTFVRIAHELVRNRGRGDLSFVIVGDGELRGETEALAGALGLGHCMRITGYRNDVCRILRDTDLLVQPSANEGFPIVALEAMSMRVPVVMTRVGGVDELIDGRNGVLVAARGPALIESFADAILSLINDPSALAERGERARATIMDAFDADRMVEKYQSLLLRLSAPASPASGAPAREGERQ
jgi:glycosyltransferase involved in cell wall biosynthesis